MSKEKGLVLKADDSVVNLVLCETNGVMYVRRPNIETEEANAATRGNKAAQRQD